MANHVAAQVGTQIWWIGEPEFLKSFFSTVCVRLEDNVWGSRFPRFMNEFYLGTLAAAHVGEARDEYAVVARELAAFAPDQVVWDADDRALQPPWGDKVAATIMNLSNYFWTADGNDLVEVLDAALAAADEQGLPVVLASEDQLAV